MAFPLSVNLSVKQSYTSTTTQKYPLGTRGVTEDGRVFRYAKNGATALKTGMGVCAAAFDNNSMAQTSGGLKMVAGTTWGTTWNVLTIGGSWGDAAITANSYKEGWLLIGSTGLGYGGDMVKIKSHTAGDGATSGTTPPVFTIEDGYSLKAAVNTSEGIGLITNPYSGTLVATLNATSDSVPLGVTHMPVAASYYYWLQTWGLCRVKIGEVSSCPLVMGRPLINDPGASTGFVVVTSSSLAVAVSPAIYAYLVAPGPAGGYATAEVKISP
jgi:hypothetical protein